MSPGAANTGGEQELRSPDVSALLRLPSTSRGCKRAESGVVSQFEILG
jgi:hypothetical protein